MRKNQALLFALLLLAMPLTGSLSGCIASASSRSDYQGQYVSPQTLKQVKPGQTRGYVKAICGNPTRMQYVDASTSLWVWEYEKSTVSSSRLAVLQANRRSEEKGRVLVEFKNDKVTRAWRQVDK